MNTIILIVGFLAGVLASMGLGGGTVLLLYLRLFTETDQLTAQVMNLIFFIPLGILSVIIYSKKGMIKWRLVLPFCILGSLGAVAGVLLGSVLKAAIVGKLFAVLLIIMGIKGLLPNKSQK